MNIPRNEWGILPKYIVEQYFNYYNKLVNGHPEKYVEMDTLARNLSASLLNCIEEKNKLLSLIQQHAEKSDQEMCWENDVELYEKSGTKYNKDKLPKNCEEHKKNCDEYRKGLNLC